MSECKYKMAAMGRSFKDIDKKWQNQGLFIHSFQVCVQTIPDFWKNIDITKIISISAYSSLIDDISTSRFMMTALNCVNKICLNKIVSLQCVVGYQCTLFGDLFSIIVFSLLNHKTYLLSLLVLRKKKNHSVNTER